MNKKHLSLLILLAGFALLLVFFAPEHYLFPRPVDTFVVHGEDATHFQKKEEWWLAMHRAAPGVQWKGMDRKVRYDRHKTAISAKGITGDWSEVGSNNLSGRTHLADYDRETGYVYLISSGGNIWKGFPENNDWYCINDHFQITGVHFFRRIPGPAGIRWVVATSDWDIQGVLYSDDQGVTWNYTSGLENTAEWGTVRRVALIIQNNFPVFYALTMEWDYSAWNKIVCIYKSTDLCVSFQKIVEYPEPLFGTEAEFDIWADYDRQDKVFVLENENFGFVDSQDQVTQIGSLPDVSGDTRLAGFDNGVQQKFYASKTTNTISQFFASADGGITWNQRGTVAERPFQMNSLAVSVIDPDIVYFGGVNAYKSMNGAVGWTKINEWWEYYGEEETKLHADIPGINPFSTGETELLFINTDGGTYMSTDQMASVGNISMQNLRVSQYYSTYTYKNNTNVIYGGSQDQGYQRTVSGQTGEEVYDFDQLISGDYGHIVSGDDGASTWSVYPGFAMYYPSAVSGTSRKTWDFIGENFYWMPQLMSDPYDPAGCFLAGGSTTSGSRIYYLHYDGSSITHSEGEFDFSEGGDARITAMAFSPSIPQRRYVLTSLGSFFSSLDEGSTWQKSQGFSGPGTHYFYGAAIAVSAINPDMLFLGGSGYSSSPVFVSYDNGASFTPFINGLPGTLVFDLALNEDETILFAAAETGAYACDLASGVWYDLYASGAPDQAYFSVEWVNNFARFGSYGRGIWDFTPISAPSAGFIAGQTVGCEGMEVLFQDISSNNPQQWLWEFEGGIPETSTLQNPPPVIYGNKGSFSVSLTVSNQSGSNTNIKEDYIHVLAMPEPPQLIMAPDSVKLTDMTTDLYTEGSPDALGYQWLITPAEAGTIDSDEMYAVLVWSDGFLGEAEISVSAYNQCGQGDYSTPITITRYLNVGLVDNNSEINLFPNPVKEFLNYKFPPRVQHITLLNAEGDVVLTIGNSEGKTKVSRLRPGVYYITYMLDDQKFTKKIIKLN